MINPEPFRKLRYKAFAGTDTLQRRNTIIDKALKLEAYDRLIQDPNIQASQEGMRNVSKDFLIGAVAPGKISRYLPDQAQAPKLPEGMEEGDNGMEVPEQNGDLLGQITGSNSLQNMMSMQNEETTL